MTNRYFRRDQETPCAFSFFPRPNKPGHQSVAVCRCQKFAVFGTSKETGYEQWLLHVSQVASGTKPTPRLHL